MSRSPRGSQPLSDSGMHEAEMTQTEAVLVLSLVYLRLGGVGGGGLEQAETEAIRLRTSDI